MMYKFRKNRSVPPHWLSVPEKYMLDIQGKDKSAKSKNRLMTVEEAYKDELERYKKNDIADSLFSEAPSFDEFKEYYISEVINGSDWMKKPYMICKPGGTDKTFVIIEFHKKYAVCAWRNEDRATVGMTFTCPIVKKNGHYGIMYKDKFYPYDTNGGWVI